jgi:hypothetical protein
VRNGSSALFWCVERFLCVFSCSWNGSWNGSFALFPVSGTVPLHFVLCLEQFPCKAKQITDKERRFLKRIMKELGVCKGEEGTFVGRQEKTTTATTTTTGAPINNSSKQLTTTTTFGDNGCVVLLFALVSQLTTATNN